ncbi:MAG: glucose-6-phosphate isomerase [Acidobacteriota bacterium]
MSDADLLFPGQLATTWADCLDRLRRDEVAVRLARKDHTLWREDPTEISNRLDWLDAPEMLRPRLGEIEGVVESVRRDGYDSAVVVGMGGSSLGAEALRAGFAPAQLQGLTLHVLDSTVPSWIRQVRAAIDPARTLFLIASKSGTTLEVTSLFDYFWGEVEQATGGVATGERFVAITDPGTALGERARELGFRHVFENPPNVGGRYSVLTFFGLVAAGLLGIDVGRLLERADTLAAACRREDPRANPGLALGALLGAAALSGRYKLALPATESLVTFGLWAEQLIAESTGKEGKGILPIAAEPWGQPEHYGDDRIFAGLALAQDDDGPLHHHLHSLRESSFPVASFHLADPYDLGAELYRWEVATAVAGHLLGIQPFDQPDVQDAKTRAKAAMEDFQQRGSLPTPETHSIDDLQTRLGSDPAPSYLALMAYRAPDAAFEAAVGRLRTVLLLHRNLATTFGYAPRLLHSTGQLHKGGPAGGLFVQLVSSAEAPLDIPGRPYDFSTVFATQALGDAEALRAQDRDVLRLDLGTDAAHQLTALAAAIEKA